MAKAPNHNIRPEDIRRTNKATMTNEGKAPRSVVVPEDIRSNKIIGNHPQPERQKDRTALDQAMDDLKDVEVSEKTRQEGEQQRMDEQMYQQLIDPLSTDQQKRDAQDYIDARNKEIRRQNQRDRSLREDGNNKTADPHDPEPAQPGRADARSRVARAARGIGATIGALAQTARHSAAEAKKSQTGDIDVTSYDYTKNGKRVHVKGHKRKRS